TSSCDGSASATDELQKRGSGTSSSDRAPQAMPSRRSHAPRPARPGDEVSMPTPWLESDRPSSPLRGPGTSSTRPPPADQLGEHLKRVRRLGRDRGALLLFEQLLKRHRFDAYGRFLARDQVD